ncbi:MAG: HAMP domain-containing protein [Deltaproteobacteria bacterium]|nr:HAMP domain-containing protein [Deltaproteobacteria bacterium]
MSFLSKTNIKTKFLLSPLFLTAMLVILVPVIFLNISNYYSTISRFSSMGIGCTQDIFILLKKIKNRHYRFDRFVKHSNLVKNAGKHAQSGTEPDLNKEKKDLEDNIQKYIQEFEQLTYKYNLHQHHEDLVNSIRNNFINYEQTLDSVLDSIGKQQPIFDENLEHMSRYFVFLEKDIETLITKIRDRTLVTMNGVQGEIKKQIQVFSVCLGLAIFITIVAGLFFSNYLSRPIQNLAATIEDITKKGTFSQRATKESEDEMGKLVDGFNQMLFEIERAQTSLVSSREELRNIIESLNQMLIVTNEKGLIKEINKQAMLFLGYINKKDIKNRFIEHLFFEETASGIQPIPLSNLLNDTLPAFTKKIFSDAFDQKHAVMVSSSVIKNPENKITGVVLIGYAV